MYYFDYDIINDDPRTEDEIMQDLSREARIREEWAKNIQQPEYVPIEREDDPHFDQAYWSNVQEPLMLKAMENDPFIKKYEKPNL